MTQNDGGHVAVWLLVAGFGLLGFIGLVGDGGRAMLASEQLNDEARAAARAGASAIDEQLFVQTGEIKIDVAEAQWRASHYLEYIGRQGHVTATPEIVLVELADEVSPRVLGLFGVDNFSISAQAEARPAVGIAEENDLSGRQP